MDSSSSSSSSFFFDNVKAEKAKAMMRYQRLSKIANLFRLLEICVLLILVSWFSTKLPVTITVLFSYFKNISIVLASPRFVFLIGNAIVLTLFVKSGQFSSPTENSGTADLYDEFVKNSVSRQKITSDASPPAQEPIIAEEICSTLLKEKSVEVPTPVVEVEVEKEIVYEKETIVSSSKKYERSQSENLKKEKPKRELRRSKTNRSCRDEISAEKRLSREEEEMSNEEFQRKIEAFIAKQVKFLREESMAIVLQN